MSGEIQIKVLDDSIKSQWDTFVQNCAQATFFHKAGWQSVIEQSYGHRMHYLYAEQGGEIVGVLPLGHVKSYLFGNALISCPFCVYGGVATENDQARDLLYNAAMDMAKELNVDHLELRNRDKRHKELPGKDLYVTFRKKIDSDPEVNMNAIPRKQRAMVRKGIQAGLVSNVHEDVNQFFDIYAVSVRNHGTPVFPKRFFSLLKREFGKDCEISVVTQGDSAIAAVMTFYFRDEVLPYYGGGTPAARQVKAFDFMYWDVMRRAGENGLSVFDYGRSKVGTGSYSFKKNWGFTPEPLHYEYYLVNSKTVPDINPLNPKYRFFINVWQKLPVPLTKIVGPMIAKNLG